MPRISCARSEFCVPEPTPRKRDGVGVSAGVSGEMCDGGVWKLSWVDEDSISENVRFEEVFGVVNGSVFGAFRGV